MALRVLYGLDTVYESLLSLILALILCMSHLSYKGGDSLKTTDRFRLMRVSRTIHV